MAGDITGTAAGVRDGVEGETGKGMLGKELNTRQDIGMGIRLSLEIGLRTGLVMTMGMELGWDLG